MINPVKNYLSFRLDFCGFDTMKCIYYFITRNLTYSPDETAQGKNETVYIILHMYSSTAHFSIIYRTQAFPKQPDSLLFYVKSMSQLCNENRI